jgi:transcriptional regulator with XRE-family HTH domain
MLIMTARAVFADLLAAYRNEARWTQAEAAEQFTMSKSLYQKIEECKRKPQRDMAVSADKLFNTPKVFARVYRDVLTEPHPPWFGPRVEFEDRATVITDWEQRGVPGLLQTKGYARAVISACRPFDSPEEIEQTVLHRLERQEIFKRERPPQYWAVIAEGVLRQLTGGREVMTEQLDHLVAMADSSLAVIQVLPYSAEAAPGVDGPAALFEFDGQPPVAYLEGWYVGQVVEDPSQVAPVATALNMIKSCALSPGESKQLIEQIRG